MASKELIEELAALDRRERDEWQAAAEAGEDFETAYQRVRQKYRDEFLGIIKRSQEAPVFRTQFPGPHRVN